MMAGNRFFPLSYRIFYLLSELPDCGRHASPDCARDGFWSFVLETSGRIQLQTVIFAW